MKALSLYELNNLVREVISLRCMTSIGLRLNSQNCAKCVAIATWN